MTRHDNPAPEEGWFDADAHVIEPPWIWNEYTPARWHDRVPRLEQRGGADWLVCDGVDLFPIGRLGGLAQGGDRSLRLTDDALEGSWEASIVDGAYRVPDRLAAMRTDGVSRALLYPTVTMSLLALEDRALLRELLRAHNRWVSDMCAEAPDSLLSTCVVDPDDLDAATHDVAQARAGGHSAILVPLWSDAAWAYGDQAYERLWALAADADLPVGFHAFAARSRTPVRTGLDLAIEGVATRPATVARAMTTLLFSGIFDRVPGLRWFSAENDAGWCAYLLERADTLYARAAAQLPIDRPPSEIFRDHVFVTFTNEPVAVANAAYIGTDNLMWGSDYPHNVTTWPGSRALVDAMFDTHGVPADVRRALTYENASRLFVR